MITDIAFFVYPVAEVARARRFYENQLGLKPGSNWENKWVEYEFPGGTFAITTMDEANRPALRGGVLAFEVKDLDAFVARLKAASVRLVSEVAETPVCRFAQIADPDGNELILHQRIS